MVAPAVVDETVKVQLAPLPQSSRARQVTVVVPMGNVLPEGRGVHVMAGVGSTLSVAVTV